MPASPVYLDECVDVKLAEALRQLQRLVVRAASMLDWIATFPDYRFRLFQWGHFQDLLDRGLRLPGYSEADLRLARGRPQ